MKTMKLKRNPQTHIVNVSLMSLILLICFLSSVFAEDYTHWSLPYGAKARLGKGSIRELTYTPDGNHILVASSIGIWTYDAHTMEEQNLFSMRASHSVATAFSPDRQMFAGVSWDVDDNKVDLWDLANHQHKETLKEQKYIKSIAFSPNGKTLAIGNADEPVQLWNVDTGEYTATLVGDQGRGTSVVFSPDGKTVATGSWDGTVRLWDAGTGEYKTTLAEHAEGIRAIVFSPDGKTVAIVVYNTIGVELWDVDTGKQKLILQTEKNIFCAAFSPDSQTLAAGGWRELYLWNMDTGERTTLTAHLEEVVSVAFSPDGETLASASPDELHLWDSAYGTQKGSITGHTQYLRGFAVSSDGHTIATGNQEKIRLWDTINMSEKTTLFDDDWGNDSLAFSPDGSILASNMGARIRLWDTATGTHRSTLTAYIGSARGSIIRALTFSPDGCFFANGHMGDETVWLWSAGFTRKKILTGHSKQVSSLAFSSDSRTLASGSFDGTIRLWDTETGTHKITLAGHTKWVESLAFSPDGKILASATPDRRISLIAPIPSNNIATHIENTESVAFSPDGKTLASGNYDGEVRLWDITTGTPKAIRIGHTEEVSHVAFTPDGSTLISGAYDGTILLWDLGTAIDTTVKLEDVNNDDAINHFLPNTSDQDYTLWNLPKAAKARIGKGWISGNILFSPDNNMLAVGTSIGTWIYDAQTGKALNLLRGHTDVVKSLAFSPDGKTLATGGG
ncbi:WD40 repeat domain-containing protein, partial [Candidatus Poribacteria bacterium]|nr:WD40 repeat domain-containing protein [Candidatus Poribacteria bacterium]